MPAFATQSGVSCGGCWISENEKRGGQFEVCKKFEEKGEAIS